MNVQRSVLLTLSLLLGACAGAPKKPSEVVWPRPPDTARIRFVRAFAAEADLGLTGWQAFSRALTGDEVTLALHQPTGLALHKNDKELYIANGPVALVVKIDFENNRMIRVADADGYAPQFPFDLDLDVAGNLYVTDSRARNVKVFSSGGKFLREFGGKLFVRPTGIVIDKERALVYVADGANRDSDHHVVEVFSTAGEHLRTIGKKGSAPGEFYFPVYLTLDARGYLYVGDTMNFRIQTFDTEGNFVSTYGEHGNTAGQFSRIKGLSFDAFGNLHVVDGEFGVVQIFNPDMQLLMAYGGRAKLLEYFDLPTAITIDGKNNIYVANFLVARVNQYEMINTAAEDSFMLPAPKGESEAE